MEISVVKSSGARNIHLWPNKDDMLALGLSLSAPDVENRILVTYQHRQAGGCMILAACKKNEGVKLLHPPGKRNRVGYWSTPNRTLRLARTKIIPVEVNREGLSHGILAVITKDIKKEDFYDAVPPKKEVQKTQEAQKLSVLKQAVSIINQSAKNGEISSMSVLRKRLKVTVTVTEELS